MHLPKQIHVYYTAYTHRMRIHCDPRSTWTAKSGHVAKAPCLRIILRTENMAQYLTALIEKHNLWLQTASCRECVRMRVYRWYVLFVQPNFWHLENWGESWIRCKMVNKIVTAMKAFWMRTNNVEIRTR